MKLLGIHFAPLHVPLHRRLETLCAAAWLITMVFGFALSTSLTLFLLTTRLRVPMALYLLWIYLDRRTKHTGGRLLPWAKRLPVWRTIAAYFPVESRLVADFDLDPRRNYLCCVFPHGVFPIGGTIVACTQLTIFSRKFHQFTMHWGTLDALFNFPFTRELLFAIGGVSSSRESLLHFLGAEGGGHVFGLVPGGAQEAFNAIPGEHRLVLRRRKGFAKIALQTGAPLIPCYSFGENECFEQVQNASLRRVQDFVKRYTGFAPILVNAGRPIDVEKVENPTTEQIDELHKKFVDALVQLFEDHKKYYIKNYENVHLEV